MDILKRFDELNTSKQSSGIFGIKIYFSADLYLADLNPSVYIIIVAMRDVIRTDEFLGLISDVDTTVFDFASRIYVYLIRRKSSLNILHHTMLTHV